MLYNILIDYQYPTKGRRHRKVSRCKDTEAPFEDNLVYRILDLLLKHSVKTKDVNITLKS